MFRYTSFDTSLSPYTLPVTYTLETVEFEMAHSSVQSRESN